ncbi:MAG: c-type cytochrome [Sinobacteraceae bacterium]|nr:c-type cytochrome [Nevskiaceae bacterium]
MRHTTTTATATQKLAAALAAATLLLLAAAPIAQAATDTAPASADAAAAHGLKLFNQDKFGGVRTCASCHVNGGTTRGKTPSGRPLPSLIGAAAHYPTFNRRVGEVVSLPERVSMCIAGGLQGHPPPLDSPQITDITAYLAQLSKGKTMGAQFNTSAPAAGE